MSIHGAVGARMSSLGVGGCDVVVVSSLQRGACFIFFFLLCGQAWFFHFLLGSGKRPLLFFFLCGYAQLGLSTLCQVGAQLGLSILCRGSQLESPILCRGHSFGDSFYVGGHSLGYPFYVGRGEALRGLSIFYRCGQLGLSTLCQVVAPDVLVLFRGVRLGA